MKVQNCKLCGYSIIFLYNKRTMRHVATNAESVMFNHDPDDGFDPAFGHINHVVTCKKVKEKELKKMPVNLQGNLF